MKEKHNLHSKLERTKLIWYTVLFLLETFIQNLVLRFFVSKKIRCKTRKDMFKHFIIAVGFISCLISIRITLPKLNLNPFCVRWLDAVSKIEKQQQQQQQQQKVKKLISVRNFKKCYRNRSILRCCLVRSQERYYALLFVPFCFKWLTFIFTKNLFSKQVFLLYSRTLTVLKLNYYIILLIIINYLALSGA